MATTCADESRHYPHDCAQNIAPISHECCARTQTFRPHCRHGRAYSKSPCLVRSSADDRTFSLPSDNYGLAVQVRIVPLLDRSIERVHVDMEDFAHNDLVTILIPCQTATLPATSMRISVHCGCSDVGLDSRCHSIASGWNGLALERSLANSDNGMLVRTG
jgi:hypothetical protein